MRQSNQIQRFIAALLSVIALVGVCVPASGGDYDDADFTLRFPAALTRFATYGDVAGVGNASAGSKWSSSVNPASQAWDPIEGKVRTCVSPQYGKVWFDNGSEFDVMAQSATVDLGRWGTFMGAAAQINTDSEEMRNGLDFDWTGDLVQIQWAKKMTDDWALGFNFGYTKSYVRNNMGNIPIASSYSDTYAIRAGTLHRLTDKLLAGLVVDYGWSADRTKFHEIPAFMMPEMHTRDTTQQFLARPGVSFEYKPNSFIYFDYQTGTYWNETGTFNTHRVFAGIEHGLNEWIYARGGTVVDMCVGETAWTGGLGFYPTTWLSFDIAYQYNMFPELSQEFGRAHTLNLSLSLTF